MHLRVGLVLICSVAAQVGCTKGSPSFTVLNQDAIPRPLFDGRTTRAITRATSSETNLIVGECDPRIRGIDVRLIDGVGNPGIPTLSCQTDGTFRLNLKSLTDLVGTPVANATYRLEFRGDTAGGMSSPSVLSVSYVRDQDQRWRLTAGGTESGAGPRRTVSSGGTFIADVRLTHLVNQADATTNPGLTTATSTNFTAKFGRAAR